MRTNDKEVAARWDRLLVPFKGHLNMRSSIARGALALLSVAAITGCQSGSTWSPTWWNPFHTTAAATPSNSVASGCRPDLRRWPTRRPAAVTAAARPPTRTRRIAAPLHPVTAPRRIAYGSGSYGYGSHRSVLQSGRSNGSALTRAAITPRRPVRTRPRLAARRRVPMAMYGNTAPSTAGRLAWRRVSGLSKQSLRRHRRCRCLSAAPIDSACGAPAAGLRHARATVAQCREAAHAQLSAPQGGTDAGRTVRHRQPRLQHGPDASYSTGATPSYSTGTTSGYSTADHARLQALPATVPARHRLRLRARTRL